MGTGSQRLTAFIIPVLVAVSAPATVRALELHEGWTVASGQGELRVERSGGYRQGFCLTLRNSQSEFAVAGRPMPIARWRGHGLKLRCQVNLQEATGDTFLAVELLRAGQTESVLQQTSARRGSTPGWVPVWLVADVPMDTAATHLRVVIRSDDNNGEARFTQISLERLPPNKPVLAGPVPPPARGVITARDGHLVDGQGERIRLWGMNCVDELGRDYRQISQIVARIKQMGFNALRLHLYDLRYIDIEARTPQNEPTSRIWRTPGQRGDGSLPDLMDYFVYCAEREGLYLYLTFDRGRAGFCPGDYDILPSAGPEDEAVWKEAITATNQSWAEEYLCFVDERVAALQLEYARRQLRHVNAYTGVSVGDDPYVALWELTNENGFPPAMLSGVYQGWPGYFQHKLQSRWNQWLRERYGSHGSLVEAWGEMDEGEDLAAGTVRLAPCLTEADQYPQARHRDFRRFVYDLTLNWFRQLESVLKTEGRVSASAPVSYDTVYEHKHTWYYPVSQGSFQAVGQYVGGATKLERRSSWLGSKPYLGSYNYSHATVADKPIVVYENNIHLPAADRAYYPLWIASFASLHDWDGVFWYVWADGTVHDLVDDQAYRDNGLRYGAVSHIWHGIVTSTDEVKLASLGLAGELFTRFLIPPAPNPVTVTVGADALLGRSMWSGDIPIPYPPEAPPPYPRYHAMAATDIVYGTRYRYDPEQPRSSCSAPLIARAPTVCSPIPGLTYDWERGTIEVNLPAAQAVVGFTHGQRRFDRTSQVKATGSPFFLYGLVSQDGRPLDQTRQARLYFGTYGENRGMTLRADPDEVTADVPRFAKLVSSWGYGPPDLARPALEFHWPRDFRVRPVDFLLQPLLAAGPIGQQWSLPAGHELFRAELTSP